MNVLMIYPEFPDTFWSFKHALGFLGKKAAFPPLGLLTIAGLLPAEWKKKLVDMNVCKLKDKDIEWADYVMISSFSSTVLRKDYDGPEEVSAGGNRQMPQDRRQDNRRRTAIQHRA